MAAQAPYSVFACLHSWSIPFPFPNISGRPNEGVAGGYTIRARMYAPADKYIHDLFLVKISKPSVFASFQHEKGFKLENGEFSFDSGAELKVGDKLEILICSAAPEDLP